MQYSATSKYIHISPRKVRLVADSIRTLRPAIALEKLSMLGKHAAEPITKVIKSALSNAQTKSAKQDELRFVRIEVMGGPMMKRWQAVARGSAHSIKKRMTHVKVVLTDVVPDKEKK